MCRYEFGLSAVCFSLCYSLYKGRRYFDTYDAFGGWVFVVWPWHVVHRTYPPELVLHREIEEVIQWTLQLRFTL